MITILLKSITLASTIKAATATVVSNIVLDIIKAETPWEVEFKGYVPVAFSDLPESLKQMIIEHNMRSPFTNSRQPPIRKYDPNSPIGFDMLKPIGELKMDRSTGRMDVRPMTVNSSFNKYPWES